MLAAALAASLVAVVAALSALSSVAAERDDARPHLFVVRDVPAQQAALERGSARVVARYDAFTLVEAAGRDAQRLRDAGADERDDMREVRVGGRSLDPRAERGQLGAKGAGEPRGPGLALVHFVGPVKDAWLERLRGTGVRVVTYVAQNGYVVHGSAAQLERLAALLGRDGALRAVTALGAADKLAPGTPSRGRAAFELQTLSGADGAQARREIAARGRELRTDGEAGPFHTQYVEADAAEVRALAADPGVVAVLRYVAPRLYDERAAQVVAANLNGSHQPTGPGYLTWLGDRGFGTGTFDFAIDVTDSGIDTSTLPGTHPDFFEGGSTSNPSRISYKRNFTQDAEARDCNGHGSNVASIAAGYNATSGDADEEDAQGYNYGLGVAPRARLGSSKIFDCGGAFELSSSLGSLTSSAYGDGARVSNNSWGASVAGTYNSNSQTYDGLVRDAQSGVAGNQQIVEVFANGNSGPGAGTVGAPGTAKNVISVGASENVRPIGFTDGCGVSDAGADSARDVISFSSRGPTDDGRTKPDVVAPGTHVTGAAPQVGAAFTGDGTCDPQFPAGNALYSLVSGTSQATPEASGFAALIRDHYRRTAGGGTTAPSPAMTKAIMVNTATDLAGGVDGGIGTLGAVPSNSQGWGRINAASAFDATQRSYTDQTVVLGATGDTHVRGFSVPDGSKPVKVTLVWSDPPGPIGGTANYVNDLDLTVTAGGETYKGNVFSGGQSATGGTADVRNNVENVFLPAGTAGSLSATVTATNVAGDGVPGNGDATDQDFALVISNASTTPTPALTHVSTDVTATSGNGNGRIEPGESFALSERIGNVGDAAATGVSGTLSASTPGVTVTQASSPYPDIPAGGDALNTTPYAATVGDSVPCGTTLQLSLAVTRAGGGAPTAIPIAVPTGQPAAAATTTPSTDVPRAIPDNSASGVESTLSLSGPGVIADLDVRITQIDHPFVGDLVIELVAPDGTTVTLASRPGGSGNSGQDLTNTIFDDEASTAIGAAGTAAPYTGRFRPQADQLSRLDGKELAGTWTLRVADVASQDVGTLEGWGVDATPFECETSTANSPPSASYTAPGVVQQDQQVTFDASGSSDADGAIAGYRWDLDGNGSFETDSGATPTVATSYATGGTRTTQLEVTDDDGATDVASVPVRVNFRPTATLSVSPSPAQVGQTVSFSAAGSSDPDFDGSIVQYRWDLDGAPGFELTTATPSATRAYASAGTFTVRVQTVDDRGGVSVPAERALGVNPAAGGDGGGTGGGGTGGGGTGGGTGGGPAADTTPPAAGISRPSTRIRDLLRGRARLRARCDEACALVAQLYRGRAPRAAATRPVVLARASGRLAGAGQATLRLRTTAQGRRLLRRARRLSVTLRLVATDAAGNRRTLDRRLTLRR